MSFIETGEFVFPYNTSQGILEALPLGTYSVMYDDMRGYGLHKESDMELPSRLYGNVLPFADRVLNTFKEKKSHMGVLLEGEKGSGKSLQAKAIIKAAHASGFSTFKVEDSHSGQNFNSFIGKFSTPFVLLFDEFEKVYDRNEQTELLSLFDGTVNSPFLAVLTVNELYNVDRNIVNRPSRAYYRVSYGKLEESVVRQFCRENLRTDLKDREDAILEIHYVSGGFNFDMLQCLVEEMNRYGEDPRDLLKILNIDVSSEDRGEWRLTQVKPTKGKDIDLSEVGGDTYSDKSPLLDTSLQITFREEGKGEKKGEYKRLPLRREHLDLNSLEANKLTFKTEGYTIVYEYTPYMNRWF